MHRTGIIADTGGMNIIKRYEINFLKCGIAGWCLEVVFTAMDSIMRQDWRLMGRTSLLMFPIYGCGVFLAPIGKLMDWWVGDAALQRAERCIRHGFLYMTLIFVMEYVSGMILRSYGICPWDYTGRQFNVNGLIRLDFAPLWFGTGLLFEKIVTKRGA